MDITRREFDHLLDIPTEEFCADEEQLILWELGKQWGKNGFTYILPILSIVFEFEPKLLEPFLLEKGLTDYSKRIVAELLARMGCDTETMTEAYNKKVHDELSAIFSRVLDAYVSEYTTGNICDKYVVSQLSRAI